MQSKNKRRLLILSLIGIILLIPMIVMQFTEEVQWKLFDFVIAAVMLLSVGFIIEVIILKIKHRKHKVILCITVILLLLLLWIELAVGIFGSPLAGS